MTTPTTDAPINWEEEFARIGNDIEDGRCGWIPMRTFIRSLLAKATAGARKDGEREALEWVYKTYTEREPRSWYETLKSVSARIKALTPKP